MFACHVFWMPKQGNTLAEYEDALWPREIQTCDSFPLRLAVADGATETSFSGLWARLLVTAYGRGRLAEVNFQSALDRIRHVWRRSVGEKPLPWYAEEKLRSGAYASLLGLTILPPERSESGEGDWHATAVGDSCLIQARGNEMLSSFPFSHSEEFNSRPFLISSLASHESPETGANSMSGRWRPGDTFFLMTDALAAWCLRGVESGENVFERLRSVEMQTQFESLVTELRSTIDGDGSPCLKNDDVTLVRCIMTL
jgi:hypothetical protein